MSRDAQGVMKWIGRARRVPALKFGRDNKKKGLKSVQGTRKKNMRCGITVWWVNLYEDNCKFIKAPRALARLLVGLQAKWRVASEADVKAEL